MSSFFSTHNPNSLWAYRQDFPIGSLPPTLNHAVLAVKANIQAPTALIVSSALAAISLACQNRLIVRRASGLEGPVSLYFICIAESGERKSTIDAIFTGAIREFEIKQAKKSNERLTIYIAKKNAWKIENKTITTAIKKQKKIGACTELLEKDLADILLREPHPPSSFKLIYADTTPEALQYGLSENGKSAGIFADEGGIFFDGYGKSGLPVYNSLWSGSPIDVARRSSTSFTLDNARLTMSLMVQEKVFQEYVARHGDLARSNGFFARCLVAYPETTQGTRFLQNQMPLEEPIDAYNSRISEILEHNDENELENLVLKFSPDAGIRWIEIYNLIEEGLRPYGYYVDMRDFASKMAENIARIAALFHYFEGDDGDISLGNVDRAYEIMRWYAEEFRRLFVPPPAIPEAQRDANVLEFWLRNTVGIHGVRLVKKNMVMKLGPNSLRKKVPLDAAIEQLALQNKVVLFLGDKFGNPQFDGRTTWIGFHNLYQYFRPI